MGARYRTIGQLARETGVGVETIRYYERRGLLAQPARPANGYRHYEDEAVRLVRYVRLAQGLGLSLKDIERLLEHATAGQATFCRAVREDIALKLLAVQAQIAALHVREAQLKRFLSDCAARSQDLPCPILAGLGPLQRRAHSGNYQSKRARF